MKRLILLILLFLSLNCKADIQKFKLSEIKEIGIHYTPKGASVYQVKKATGAKFVFGGGYFKPSNKKVIDYIKIDNKTIKNYRWDWNRPILHLNGKHTTIIKPKKETYKSTYKNEIALDSVPTNPRRIYRRQIIAIKNGYIYFIRHTLTYSASLRLLKRYGFTNYVYCDGGSSSPASAAIPTRIYIK